MLPDESASAKGQNLAKKCPSPAVAKCEWKYLQAQI